MINPSQTIYAPEELFSLQALITNKTHITAAEPALLPVMDSSVEIPIAVGPETGFWKKHKGTLIAAALITGFITWVIYELNQEKKRKYQSN